MMKAGKLKNGSPNTDVPVTSNLLILFMLIILETLYKFASLLFKGLFDWIV